MPTASKAKIFFDFVWAKAINSNKRYGNNEYYLWFMKFYDRESVQQTLQDYNLFPSLGNTTEGLKVLASSKSIRA